jgi:hypothetical protein
MEVPVPIEWLDLSYINKFHKTKRIFLSMSASATIKLHMTACQTFTVKGFTGKL